MFARAQKLLVERRLVLYDDKSLRSLRVLLARKGKLTGDLASSAPRFRIAS